MSLFVLPLVGRAGLGNGLFPWARAEVFARQYNARILAPRWPRVRVGPHLRREPEKRRYGGFFHAPHHVHGIHRLLVATFARRIPEGQIETAAMPVTDSHQLRLVEHTGLGDLFAPLLHDHSVLRELLWDMTAPSLRTVGTDYGGRFIAMHVRRGDLTRQGFTQRQLSEVMQYTPLSWFLSMARAVRGVESLRSIPIVVFTDGGKQEVQPLAQVGGVEFQERQPAITDLWTLVHARLLFASGYSTFSMWASFLGGMPTVYARGKLQQFVQAGRIAPTELELAEGEGLPATIIERVAR